MLNPPAGVEKRAGRIRPVRPRRLGILSPSQPAATHGGRRQCPYAVGDRIAGDLTIIGHLAEGRRGHLYQVWSASEWCAFTCKILAPELRDDRAANAALRREARILKLMRHPNVIQSYGGGEHDGLPFLLMEYLEGPSLFDLLESRPKRRLTLADAVRAAIHIGAGVYYLHRHGWLHLDLKPANLLLRDSVPVLVDFDAAGRIDPDRKPAASPGTGPYMSPEQVRCDPLMRTADVYGLGALLYEMVTGRWAFEDVYTGNEPRSGAERQFPQIGADLPHPPRRYNEEIPEVLEALIMRCLAPDPEDRYPSMHPLLLELAALLDEPVALWPSAVRTERRREPRD
jgi:serine/threonine protein kinase